MVGTYWMIDIGIATITSILLVGIFLIYLRNWRRFRSKLLLGPMVFALIFLIGNLVSVPQYIVLSEEYKSPLAFQMMVMHSFQLAGFLALLWTVLR